MSLFQELKRRNVFRVGVAYAVAAWIVLQITDVVGEILELPVWGGKLVLLVVLAGFPLSLVLAWAFELTPEGVRREKDVERDQSIAGTTGKRLDRAIIALLVVALGYFVWESRFAERGPTTASEPGPDGSAQIAAVSSDASAEPDTTDAGGGPDSDGDIPNVDPRSIAVLPFDNRSRLEDDAFFVEGIHDDLLTNLARIGELKVISRTSVTRYAGSEKSIPEIARELGVATVMEGAVQRSGDMVRINVQLIDAVTDEHLWAQIFDRTLTADNLFAIQSEISEQIAEALATELSEEESARLVERPTENLEAYTAYLRGRKLLVNRRSDELALALASFRRATELDPDFALAWVGIADAASLLRSYGTLPFNEAVEIRRQAVDRAMALDMKLGEAHLALASLLDDLGQDPEPSYRRALELSPSNATAYHWYANHLDNRPQRVPEAIELLERALELDPLSSIIHRAMVTALIRKGRLDDAQRRLDDLLALDPEFVPAYAAQARLHMLRGRLDLAVEWGLRASDMDPNNIGLNMNLLWTAVSLDDDELLETLHRRIEAVDPDSVALVNLDMVSAAGRGNFRGALEHLGGMRNVFGDLPWLSAIEGYNHAALEDAPKARAAFEAYNPDYFDPALWRGAIEAAPSDACHAAWMLMNTGEPDRGAALLETTLAYMEQELPRYVDYPKELIGGIDLCYLLDGDMESVLAVVEARFAHRRINQWFWYEVVPIWAPIVREPRFQAVNRQLDAILAEQRENLRHSGVLGAGP